MEIIYLLVPLSLIFLVLGIWFFFWAIKYKQFDDMEGPAHRILLEGNAVRRPLHVIELLVYGQKEPDADHKKDQLRGC